MDRNMDKNVIIGVNFVKIGHFGESDPNWVSLRSFVVIFALNQRDYLFEFYSGNIFEVFIKGVNFFKICHFGENDKYWLILAAKMTSYVKIWGKWSNNFFP